MSARLAPAAPGMRSAVRRQEGAHLVAKGFVFGAVGKVHGGRSPLRRGEIARLG